MQRLTRDILAEDPTEQFARWFEEMKNLPDAPRPAPVCVSTVGADGWPDSRMVLLKGFDKDGFVFYTNLHSPKATALTAWPHVALCFHWEAMLRQVRIQGTTTRVTDYEADRYWQSRSRNSQIAAWASEQSAVVPGPEYFESRVAELTEAFAERPVPRPASWGGFRVLAFRIEFWQEQPHRLHDRFVYLRHDPDGWQIQQLYP